jgi:preprotein translocase subunit YajC
MKNKIIVVVVLIIVAAGAFYFGVQNGKASATTAATAARSAFTRGAGVTRAGGTAIMGQVVSVDSNSLTISLASGSSQIIFFTPATPITKTVSGSVGDLAVGTNILVAGTANSDGSESATSIQIRPAGFGTTTRTTTGQ